MTKTSSLLLLSLLLFCGLTFAADNSSVATQDTSRVGVANNHKVIVYYLYFTPRCETCLTMEAFSREAVETGFANELKQGTVEWRSYDTGKKQYEHYWNDFKLETKSLIMVDIQNGKQARWKNCDKIWDLVGAKPDFLTYVQNEVRAYLRGDTAAADSVQTAPEAK